MQYMYVCTRNQDLRFCSRIQDMVLWDEPNIELECQSVHSTYSCRPLTASITMEIKNVTTQRNKLFGGDDVYSTGTRSKIIDKVTYNHSFPWQHFKNKPLRQDGSQLHF